MNSCNCNPSKHGRGESKLIKDDDSVLSDRCWEEMYKGDSRKWLIRDGSRQKIDSTLCSTMKATYQYPYLDDKKREYVGKKILVTFVLPVQYLVQTENVVLVMM